MILFFHFICLLTRHIVTEFFKSLGKAKMIAATHGYSVYTDLYDYPSLQEELGFNKSPAYESGILKFFPPVYIQRYETVAYILKDLFWVNKIKKVVDFGCADLGFFMYLKNLKNVTEILEVDINSDILQKFSYKAAPLTSDYLMNKRSKPLDVYILEGSVADYDDYLSGCDAVICIELIEHLEEETLNNLPYNIFSKVKPKLAIFTTPNADFNSLFPDFKDIRHEDHKFEWSRKEFYNWTQEVLEMYPEYTVKFYGIGAGPEEAKDLGYCTQMAVFERIKDLDCCLSTREEFKVQPTQSYKLIKHYNYPAFEDTRTIEEKICHEIQHQVSFFSNFSTYYDYETNESEIPLSLLKEYVLDLCPDDEEFRNILTKNGMTLRKKKKSWFLVHSDLDSYSSDEYKEEDSLDEENADFSSNEGIEFEEEWPDDDEQCCLIGNEVG